MSDPATLPDPFGGDAAAIEAILDPLFNDWIPRSPRRPPSGLRPCPAS